MLGRSEHSGAVCTAGVGWDGVAIEAAVKDVVADDVSAVGVADGDATRDVAAGDAVAGDTEDWVCGGRRVWVPRCSNIANKSGCKLIVFAEEIETTWAGDWTSLCGTVGGRSWSSSLSRSKFVMSAADLLKDRDLCRNGAEEVWNAEGGRREAKDAPQLWDFQQVDE